MTRWRRQQRLLALFCAVAVTAAVWIARSTAPETYELSIYTGTPLVVWILLGSSAIIGSLVVLFSDKLYDRLIFGGVAVLAISVVVWMPMVRGYFFFDEEDAMTHWGTLQAVADGRVPITDSFYPGTFSIGLAVSEVTGQSHRWSLLFVSLIIITISVLLIATATRLLAPSLRVGGIALVLALLFGPLNPLNVLIAPHPSTQAIFFSAVPLTLYFLYFRTGNRWITVTLTVSLLALYFYHPQQAINFLLFMGGVSVASEVLTRITNMPDLSTKDPIPVYLAVALFAGISILSHAQFQSAFNWIVISTIYDVDAGGVSGRAGSVDALGISISEFLFKAGAKYIPIGLGALGAIVFWWRRRDSTTIPVPSYLIGLVPILAASVVFFVIGGANQMVRYVGMAIMLTVPLAAVGLRYLVNELPAISVHSIPVRQLALAGILVFGLIAAVPVMHNAPYTERYGLHVTEGQYEGYETAFNYADDGATFHHVRSRAERYHHAINGYVSGEPNPPYVPRRQDGGTPDHFEGGVNTDPYYISITEADIQRDAELYQGFRYSHKDFQKLQETPKYDRVYHNAHLKVYLNKDGDNDIES